MTGHFSLTDDQLAIQDLARKFTADRITPFAAQWDEEHHFPVEVWKAAGELGFGAIYVSEENGGIGLGRLESALIIEAMAKRLATDSGSEVVNQALQLFGGYGYLKDYPIERFWRDLRVHSILEGTNQVMRMIIGRDLLRQ